MADYEAVPRALSRLGRTAREVIPIRAEREASRARMGLERAKTEFTIGQAKETTAYRKRMEEAGKDVREAAGATARRKIEELRRGEEYVTSGHFFAGSGVKDLFQIKDKWLPALKEGAGIERIEDPQPGGPKYTKHGKPYKIKDMEPDIELITQIFRTTTGGRHILATLADESNKKHPWHEKAKKMLAENDELGIAKINLRILHDHPPLPGSPPAVTNMYTNRVKEVNAKIARLEGIASKEKIAKIKAAGKIPTVGGVKIGTKEERKEGDQVVTYRRTKTGWKEIARGPRTVKEPKDKDVAAGLNRVLSIIDKVTKKGERAPSKSQAAVISKAAAPLGFEYVEFEQPVPESQRHWYNVLWWDDATRKGWGLREIKKAEPGATKPGEKGRGKIKQSVSQKEMKEIDQAGKKVPREKPITERPDPLGIRRVK